MLTKKPPSHSSTIVAQPQCLGFIATCGKQSQWGIDRTSTWPGFQSPQSHSHGPGQWCLPMYLQCSRVTTNFASHNFQSCWLSELPFIHSVCWPLLPQSSGQLWAMTSGSCHHSLPRENKLGIYFVHNEFLTRRKWRIFFINFKIMICSPLLFLNF